MKHLYPYLRRFRKESILAPLFKMLEATFDLLVPMVVADIIKVGIAGGDTTVHLDALRPAGADGAHRTALLLHRAVFRGARRHRHIHRTAA